MFFKMIVILVQFIKDMISESLEFDEQKNCDELCCKLVLKIQEIIL